MGIFEWLNDFFIALMDLNLYLQKKVLEIKKNIYFRVHVISWM